ncbi:hypothetical protein AX15_002726 [Amanita polypyramis BW_CC]|nr:hypothetical protein AX15_002726 [Amanita polypyramis BW_CC]
MLQPPLSNPERIQKPTLFPQSLMNGQPTVQNGFYHDGPSPPNGLFDDFLRIPSVAQDVHQRNLSDLIESFHIRFFNGLRGVIQTAPVLENTPNVVKAILNETIFWGADLASKSSIVLYLIEPFLPTILSHNLQPTAYPPKRDKVYLPSGVYFGWTDMKFDEYCFSAVWESAARIRDVAISDRQDVADTLLYPNYAKVGTKLENMYGEENVKRSRRLKKRVDPVGRYGVDRRFYV